LGADFSPAKLQAKTKPVILSVEYDLVNMRLEVTEQRRKDLKDEIEEIQRQNRLSPGQAGKLKGKADTCCLPTLG
jgi:hypothetical protein